MTKHTPGPWGVKYSTKRNGGPFEGWTEYDIHSHEGCFLVLRQYPGGDEADANATLISAAPDLLEALREIHNLAMAPTVPERVHQDWPTNLVRRIGEIRLAARAALAKAEGKPE